MAPGWRWQEDLLNKVVIVVFFAHKKYSHSFGRDSRRTWRTGPGKRDREREKTKAKRERQLEGVRRPRGTPPSYPLPVGWPSPATSVGGTGPTLPSSLADEWWTAPVPPSRRCARRHFPQPAAICGMSPGAVLPSRRVGSPRSSERNRWRCCSGLRPTRLRSSEDQ